MNNTVVMRAIAKEMDFLYNKVFKNPINEGKDLSKIKKDIKDLYDAYFELRGYTGTVVYISGADKEANNVKYIYEATFEE